MIPADNASASLALAAVLLGGAVASLAFFAGRVTQRRALQRQQRALADERRREFDSHLSKIASQVPGMVFQLKQHPDGRRCLPFASDGIREIYRLEPDWVVHDASVIASLIHPEDMERFAASIDESARDLTRWQCEYRTRFADGSMRWLAGTAMPERKPDGSVVWHGFIGDVTERKRAEQAHEENRVLLQSVFSSVDLGVFVVDITAGGDFRFVEVNPAYERMSGICAAEIRGRGPRDLVPQIPAEMAECLRASFRRGAEAAGPIEAEEPFFARGRLLWWHTRLTPVRDSIGNVVRLVGRSLDITERKTIELRFQSLTERLQLATEAAQVGIWDHDLLQERIVWDQRMLQIYGLAAAEFDGSYRGWRERIYAEDKTRVDREHREAVEGKRPFNTSFRIFGPGGEQREIRACAHVQRNPAGRPVRMVGVNWDVTAERRAQAEIVRARDEAERLNRQLAEALTRATELARQAGAATVAKSEFLANMSHEIRTPLNAIIGMSGLVLGTDLSPEQRECAETIRSSGDGLLRLINDILDYSKIESGRLDLEHHPFDLRECVESSLDLLAARAAEKQLDLVFAIDSSVPEAINGDDTRLRQVLVNLLSNAVKFTTRGEVFLSVGVAPGPDRPPGDPAPADPDHAARQRFYVHGQLSPPPCRIRFAVHDSGIGIPPDRMDRLFKTFSQVDASTTRKYGGTGLGLAICKRLVELMGGQIWVESTKGKGSVFIFEIPAKPLPVEARPFAAGRSPLLVGRRILVVDDNVTSARVLCQQCVSWGLTPRAVASAAEARNVLAHEPAFDLALIDLAMPGTSGQELVAEIRRDRSSAQLPIGVLTHPGQSRLPAELGVAGSLSKPIKPAALFELLTEMLHGRQAAVPTTAADGVTLGEEHPLSILVAEDNPVNQRVAALMLQRLGYRADLAVNGREALEAIARADYDLVLMDVQMPEMDGLQATREIRALEIKRQPRIVAMTANTAAADRTECLAAGMDDFLGKPVRPVDLRKALEATRTRSVASAA